MSWFFDQLNLRFLVFEAAHHHRRLYDLAVVAGLPLSGLNRDPVRMRVTRVDEFGEMRSFRDFVTVRGLGADPLPKVCRPSELAGRFTDRCSD